MSTPAAKGPLLAVWQAWVDTTWMTTWFDPRLDPVRALLINRIFAWAGSASILWIAGALADDTVHLAL